jgi:hypothetical protein
VNSPTTVCRLCGAEAQLRGQQRMLRYQVAIFQCPVCDLMQTEDPYWIAEAYSKALTLLDTGAVQRGQLTAGLTLGIARLLGLGRDARCIDYGGGHGLYVRMMRDRGFDFRWTDRYAENLFARGFDGDLQTPHDLLTTFEVFEHLVDVGTDIATLFEPGHRFALVGTLLHNGYQDGWWYFTNRTGQHVAFYSPRTLRYVASRYGYSVLVGPEYSLFIRDGETVGRVARGVLARLVARPWLAFGLTSLIPDPVRFRFGHSRTHADHLMLDERLRTDLRVEPEARVGAP